MSKYDVRESKLASIIITANKTRLCSAPVALFSMSTLPYCSNSSFKVTFSVVFVVAILCHHFVVMAKDKIYAKTVSP